MLIIIDKKIPDEAKGNLSRFGEVVELETSGITNDYLSGHPDIFFCKINDKLICAPNLPKKYFDLLKKNNIDFIKGSKKIDVGYFASAVYNAVSNDKYFIHNLTITDEVVLENRENLKTIDVKQGFSRCSVVPIKNTYYITSDRGIEQTLRKKRLNVLYVTPDNILLPGMNNGLFGGCCGVFDNKLFVLGSLSLLPEEKELKDFLYRLNYEIVELYNGPLFDGGSILFL